MKTPFFILFFLFIMMMFVQAFSVPPVFEAIGENREMNSALFIYEGTSFSFAINAIDPDGDPLTYWTDTTSLPVWLHFNATTHTLSGTAPLWSDVDSIREQQAGIIDVNIYVSDGTYTVERVFTIHILDSAWADKTVQELIAERDVNPLNSTIGTPVQINITSIDTVWSNFGGGKYLRKITFGFRSQEPTLDTCINDWVSNINFAFLPIDTPSVYNAGGLVEGDYSQAFGADSLGEKTCAELDIPILVFDLGWYWDYGVELMDKYQAIAFQTRDPHYLFYVFSSSHFLRSIDALVTVIDSLTSWQVSYSDFNVVFTGHSKFGHSCYVAAAADNRISGIVPSGASILESGGARLLGITQGASGTKPDAFYDYKGLMMRKYVESIAIESQIDTSVFIMQVLGTDDDKSRITGYTPKYVLLESSNHLSHDFRTGCIPNAPHTTQTSFHQTYWEMTLAKCFLNRKLSSVDTSYYYYNGGNIVVNAIVSGNPSIQQVGVWATLQSDTDTSAWNGFQFYPMTLTNNIYQTQIPYNSTAFFVLVSDEDNGIKGFVSSQPTPVNRNYPQLFLPPGNVDSLNISRTGNNIYLSWNNPNSSDYVGTAIVYSTNNFPETPIQGTLIYDGNTGQFTHTVSDTSTIYYYTVFCYDSVGNYSSGKKINSLGQTEFAQELSINNDLKFAIFPNPASNIVNISFTTTESCFTQISIYDIYGKKTDNIYTGNLSKGSHLFSWNFSDKKITKGTYFCIIETNNSLITKRFVVIR